jgi:repressor LexA
MIENYKNKITTFYKKSRRMPTYSEIMKLLSFKSKNSVFKLVSKLSDEGFLRKDRNGRLVPEKLFAETKMAGLVEAGFPSPAEEELSDTMSIDDYLIENKEATYIMRVKGDSMIEAGICDGDMVIVERTKDFPVGKIVIASVDGGWTMKYLRKKNGQFFLEPANKKYKPIYPGNELKVEAIVKAVVRKY